MATANMNTHLINRQTAMTIRPFVVLRGCTDMPRTYALSA
jgi:hypothetical protein